MCIYGAQSHYNSQVKDIMHVWTVVSAGTKPCDVELAQFLLLGQLDVMAEVTVVTLLRNKNHYP